MSARKTARLKTLNRKYPTIKILLAFAIVGLIIGGLVVANGREDDMVSEWQVVSEREIAVRLELDNEHEGVGEVTDMPGVGEEKKEDSSQEASVVPVSSMGNEQREAQVSGAGGLIALTFDDGPAATTGRLLDILRDKNARATFFVLGSLAEKRPDILQRAVAEGHEIGNHTMNHKNFNQIDSGSVGWEIAYSRDLIQGITGQPVKYTRPPYGIVNDVVKSAGAVTLWSVDPKDWKDRDAEEVRRRVGSAVSDGAIVLMHDIYGTTVDAVGGIIDDLRATGYEVVTLSELFTAKGWEPIAGNVYTRVGG